MLSVDRVISIRERAPQTRGWSHNASKLSGGMRRAGAIDGSESTATATQFNMFSIEGSQMIRWTGVR